MSNTYWLTFRIHDIGNYQERRDDLYKALDKLSSMWWIEPTSFVVFKSDSSADTIASKVKEAIDPRFDIALLGMTDIKSARLIGASKEDDIFQMISFLKRV